MKFSVITPTRDRAAMLETAIASALGQTHPPHEVFVIDDGSRDETPAVLDRWGTRIRALRGESKGPAAARNLALPHLTGDYVVFLDSDDAWPPWTLATMAAALRSGAPVTLLDSPWDEFSDEAELPQLAVRAGSMDSHATSFPHFLAGCALGRLPTMGSIAVSTAVFRDLGGFDPTLRNAEDFDLWLRLGTHPGYVRLEGKPLVWRRRHGGQLSAPSPSAYAGVAALVAREKDGRYPGGPPLATQRRIAIAEAALHYAPQFASAGMWREAWSLTTLIARWRLADPRLPAARLFRDVARRSIGAVKRRLLGQPTKPR